jgi:hypothetical protein
MPWRRNDPDPLEEMRQKLAEQERIIAEKLARIGQGLDPNPPDPADNKPAEPPVWRLEEDGHAMQATEMMPARKRHLARQRQRDMLLFFIAVGILIIVMSIVVWVACFRNGTSTTGP